MLIVEAAVTVLLISGLLVVIATSLANLLHFRDVGYPESATLLRVQEFSSTGQIYPQFDRPPYLVTLYGPLFYVLLGSLNKIAEWFGFDSRIIMRVGIAASLSICLLNIFHICVRFYLERWLAFLSVLFAVSIASLASWTTQIRGDLPAIGLSLSSFCIFVGGTSHRRRIVAAICAGLALLVKQTAIAVPCAILIWYFSRREFREGFRWIGGVSGTFLLGYAVAYLREPLVLSHLAALSQPVFEFHGALQLIREGLSQPQFVFGTFGIFLAIRGCDSHELLFPCYWLVSWIVAITSLLQIGGDRNYLWEPLLLSAIAAGPGVMWFTRKLNGRPRSLRIITAIILCSVFFPVLKMEIFQLSASYGQSKIHASAQSEWESFISKIAGHRMLSTFPDISVRSDVPEIADPFLNTVLEQGGKWDYTPILQQISSQTYDFVVVRSDLAAGATFHRGLGIWPFSVWRALRQYYALGCVLGNMEVWLPRNDNFVTFAEVLSTTNCKFISSKSN
jgi:hypothetical protein